MELLDVLSSLFGIGHGGDELDTLQMVLRAVLVYAFALLIVKAAKKRFMGQYTALDVVMIIILGSVLSRGVNGSAPLLPTLAASAALVLVHRFMAWVSFHSPFAARLIEGEVTVLVRNGQIDWTAMRRHDITERDLHMALRTIVNSDDFSSVKHVYLEPGGKFSVVKAQ